MSTDSKRTSDDNSLATSFRENDHRSTWNKFKPWTIVLLPILLLPLPLFFQNQVALFAYCLLIIALSWIFEILNIYFTAFLPMVLLPLTGVISPNILAK